MSWESDVSWPSLRAFIEADVATGGPDPHMTVIAEAGRRWPSASEAWWPAVCFVAGPYTVAGGTAIAANAWYMSVNQLESWLRENWKGIPIRGERRCVKSPRKMAESIVGTREWAAETFDPYFDRSHAYEDLWAGVQKFCPYMGRYGAMKLLETWWRGGLITEGQPDIRPDGAKYPRRMLAALNNYPALRVSPKEGGSGNTHAALEHVNWYATEAKDRVGYDLTWCSFETLLCNYRQALQKGKYPGGSHDRELQHWLIASEHFGRDTMLKWLPFYEIRATHFPASCLGEVGGWTETRKELEMPWRQRYEATLLG